MDIMKLLLVVLLVSSPAAALAPLRASPRLMPVQTSGSVFSPGLGLGTSVALPPSAPALGALILSAPADSPVSFESAGRFVSVVPSWFDASRLEFVLVRQDADGFSLAILRRGRFELAVYLDARNGDEALFTQHALNPMGTPRTETVALGSGPARRAVAELLRRAPAPDNEGQTQALSAIITRLEQEP